ncbi:hypothetical protein [uncultured Methylobacterium sp.]|uniref:hypothetical protein n=1 Tax=uncultured Methylobacterium sp. TaxID=157278 RepID=UPI0035CB2A94
MPTGDLKHRAKRWTERIKLIATLFNSVSIVTVAAAFINPIANRHYNVPANGGWLLLVGAECLHGIGQVALTFLRAEE